MYENENPNPNSNPMATKVQMGPTFFGKVMTFFALAIFSSAVGVYVTMNYFMHYFVQMPQLIYVFFVLELAIIFTSRWWSQKRPLNGILFAAFTLFTGITVAPLIAVLAASPGGSTILMQALLATGMMFTATAVIGWTTSFNLSGIRGFLVMGLIGMIIVGVMGIFIPWGNSFEIIYSGIGVLLFAGFTMYDMQKLKRYPENMYLEAALSLYLDIFNLFLHILRLIMALNRR
ncbi:MAG: Bax inhibitor-1/YccA family protein [Candidatus Gracilibacteria bacterium]|nr:Bax inhibitor-1/YccA family protein [Candidatus Gracilibacteria bacterium]